MDGLTEDGIAVLIPEILAVLVLERFQLQSRLVIHEPCAVCTVGLEDGEVQCQHIVKADVPGYRYADFGSFGITQNAPRHIDAGAVDEGGLLSLAETLGKLNHKVSFQIKAEVADEIGLDGGDDSQLVSGHILLRETLCGGGNGAVFGYPRREIIVVGEPDLAVALGGIHNGADPAEEVIFVQGSSILGGSALREQIGVGEAVLAVNEVTVGFVAATHGLPKAVVVAADTGSYVLVVDVIMRTRKCKGEFVAAQPPYGYMKDPDVKRKIIPNPDTAPVVRKIFDLALEGKTPAEIAVVLNDYKLETPSTYYMRMNPDSKKFRTSSKEACWTVSNVREILKRREYTGVMVMNQRRWKGLDNPRTVWTDESEWQIIPDCHEAIVSESEFEEAQKVFRKIRKGYDRSPDQYLLRSLVHCGACGRTMQRQKHSPVIYYTCLKSVSNRETACPVGERFIEADLERIVKNDLLEKLRLLVDADDRLYAAAAASEGTEENLRFRLEQIEKRMKQISVSRVSAYERYAEGRLQRDIYLMERDKLNAENDRLSAEKERLEKELLSLSQSRNRELTETCDLARRTLTADELTNEMLLFFIDRVNVYSGMRVEIIYRFSDEIARLIGQENTAE